MSDLAQRLVQLVAENALQRYKSEYAADHLSWQDFAKDAGEDVVAVLRELAGLIESRAPVGGVPRGGHEYAVLSRAGVDQWLVALADSIKKGGHDGSPLGN